MVCLSAVILAVLLRRMCVAGQQIFHLAWSADGKRCATLCKDGKIRVYEPRISTEPVAVS